MLSKIKGLFHDKKSSHALESIAKPKWLEGVSITRCDDCFKVKIWEAGHIIIKDKDVFKNSYRSTGNYSRANVNMIGEHVINFTTAINGLDVSQCFSLAKSILLNRVAKDGDGNKLYALYDGSDSNGVLIKQGNDDMIVQSIIQMGEEVVVNDMLISIGIGPNGIVDKYGKPDILLHIDKGASYKIKKNANLRDIILTWGDTTTKYLIRFKCDVVYKKLIFEIVIR